jgi:hypothetical protein
VLASFVKDGALALDLSDEVLSAVVVTHDGKILDPALSGQGAS